MEEKNKQLTKVLYFKKTKKNESAGKPRASENKIRVEITTQTREVENVELMN